MKSSSIKYLNGRIILFGIQLFCLIWPQIGTICKEISQKNWYSKRFWLWTHMKYAFRFLISFDILRNMILITDKYLILYPFSIFYYIWHCKVISTKVRFVYFIEASTLLLSCQPIWHVPLHNIFLIRLAFVTITSSYVPP